MTRTVRVAYLGFGNVGRRLYQMLREQSSALEKQFGVRVEPVGIATRRAGYCGFDEVPGSSTPIAMSLEEWLGATKPDVVFETLPLDPHGGEPALSASLAILDRGIHVVSANKGPVVYGYDRLITLARARGVSYRFESAVMDGAPVFSLFEQCLPLAGVTSIRGIFTSTATVVLEALEQGESIDTGINRAQRMGIAEADPSFDIDGWDTAVKLCAMARVVFGRPLLPSDVTRSSVRSTSPEQVRDAMHRGRRLRLTGTLDCSSPSDCVARADIEELDSSDPLAVSGTSLVLQIRSAIFPDGLTVVSGLPDLGTTAYGMLTDFLKVVQRA